MRHLQTAMESGSEVPCCRNRYLNYTHTTSNSFILRQNLGIARHSRTMEPHKTSWRQSNGHRH